MPLTIEAEPFITSLRERLAMKLENHMNVQDVLAVFDRSTTEAIFRTFSDQGEMKKLTPRQKAWQTRRQRNAEWKAREAQAQDKPTESPVGSEVE